MKKISMFLMFALAACGAGSFEGVPPTGGVTAEAGTVKGMAVDSQNRRLAGAKINVCSSVFSYSCIDGTTGADGSYSFRLTSDNVWRASASITRSYNGATHCLPLAVDNPNSFNSTDGAIRNFSWRLSGVKPGSVDDHTAGSYFGATLSAVVSPLNQNQVRVNLVPNEPLIDGSAGSSLSEIAGNWRSNAIGNIPLGTYTVTAQYIQPGGAVVPLRVSLTPTVTDLAPSVTIQFPPDPYGSCEFGPEAAVYIGP